MVRDRALRILVSLVVLVLGSAANAASVTLELILHEPSEFGLYTIGSLYEVRLTGDAMGASDTTSFIQINFDSSEFILERSGQTPMTSLHFGESHPWHAGSLASGSGFAVALNQIAPFAPSLASVPESLYITSIFLRRTGVSEVFASVEPATFDFFGAGLPDPLFLPIDVPVPEPTSFTLLGLGLALVAWPRRR